MMRVETWVIHVYFWTLKNDLVVENIASIFQSLISFVEICILYLSQINDRRSGKKFIQQLKTCPIWM